MEFLLAFTNSIVPTQWLIKGDSGLLAQINIGDFSEDIVVITNYWSREKYLFQWQEGVSRLIEDPNCTKSALATAVHEPQDPKHGYIVQWWTLYKEDTTIYVQSQSIPKADNKVIDLNNLYSYIPNRVQNANDERSEWRTDLTALKAYSDYLSRTH